MFKESQLRQVHTEGSAGGSYAASLEVSPSSAGKVKYSKLNYPISMLMPLYLLSLLFRLWQMFHADVIISIIIKI